MASHRIARVKATWVSALVIAAAPWCSADRDEAAEQAVIEIVEGFLRAAGEFDLEHLPGFFAPNANIGATSFRDGRWVTSTRTF